MNAWFQFPVLAVDVDTIITGVVVVIIFLSWIVNLIGGQKKAQAPKARGQQNRPRPGQERLQNEIEVFLQEVQGRKKPENKPVAQAPPELPPRQPEARPKRSRQPQQRKRPSTAQRPKKPARSKAPLAQSPASTEIKNPELGTGVGGLKDRHLDSKIDQSVSEHMTHLDHLEPGIAPANRAAASGERSNAASQQIGNLLRDPAGVRQAILLNEILSRPVGMRPRS